MSKTFGKCDDESHQHDHDHTIDCVDENAVASPCVRCFKGQLQLCTSIAQVKTAVATRSTLTPKVVDALPAPKVCSTAVVNANRTKGTGASLTPGVKSVK